MEKAYTAGILHDILKKEYPDRLLQRIDDVGIILTLTERNSPSIWHAFASAVYIRDVLGIEDDDILNAVMYHTTARTGMSMLEKIIYLADYTSYDRTHKAAKLVYDTAVRDIDKAMIDALGATISCLAGRQVVICEKTIDAYNEFVSVKP